MRTVRTSIPRLFTRARVTHRPAKHSDNATTLPALNPASPLPAIPSIRKDDIRTRVFTHRSFHARPNDVFEDSPDNPSPDNELYEFLGDSILRFVVTRLILKMYPNLRVGPCTKIRDHIVSNCTLAGISCRYALATQLRIDPAQEFIVRASVRTQADVFESYVGGLYLDQGLTAVEKWFEALITPYAIEAYTLVRTKHGLPPLPSSASPKSSPSMTSTGPPLNLPSSPSPWSHLASFNERMQKEKRKVEFRDRYVAEGTATTPMWTSHAEVDGKVLGRGKGLNKKAARNEAAKKALAAMGALTA